MSGKVTDHRYDSGPINVHALCIGTDKNGKDCERPEKDHAYSEYERAPGDMHEPKPYPASSLDWTTDGLAINEKDQ